MHRSEKETREQLIDPKLMSAGWDVLTTKYLVQKNKACIETPVTGMPKTSDNQSGNGFVDYVLFGDDGKPLALIEAKKSVANEEQGRAQALLYADALERQYGQRPVAYYTNGYSIMIVDGLYPAREVFGFHKKDELEYLIQRRGLIMKDTTPNPAICDRYYQQDAITEIINHLGTRHSRSLIVLATGTGKTRVSCALSDIFLRNNFVKRILFLADRKNLVVQAKEETFEKYLSNVPMATIIEGKHTGAEDARIVFSTYQSMLSLIKDTSKSPFGIGHFDLIIVDEAHRSLFNKYAEIFAYFDALMIGLTATPRNDIHKSTYKVFNLDQDMPNYEYDLVKGVKDGYLKYFRALDRTPDILRNGLVYDDLSDEEKEQYEELFTEDDGTLPDKIEGKEFYSVITNKDTIRAVLRDLMEEGLKVNNGDTLGKTIIFARDHNHALAIQKEFRGMYPELCNPTGTEGSDYCVIIDNKIRYNEILQRNFKEKQDIRIVISVDMMDTGVDIPEVVNLVFFKKILSKIKFWQMIGRGTRTCNNLNIMSPDKTYFERLTNDTTRQVYSSKQGFLIFDVCNAFAFFKLNPDGRTDHSEQALSLNQKIFMEKVALFKAMQVNYSELEPEDREFYGKLRNSLVAEISGLNRNFIGVQQNLKYVERYGSASNWTNITQACFNEIKQHIAPNITGEIDLESSKLFDYLAYKFSATKLTQTNAFAITAKTIYSLALYLLQNKMHIGDVAKHKGTLEYLQTDDFLISTSVTQMDRIRREIRDLFRYIERQAFDPIVSDFDDHISKRVDAEDDDVDFKISIDDFKTLKEKVLFYIRNNTTETLVYQIQNLVKPTNEAITCFKDAVKKIAKNDEEYNGLFASDDGIVPFVRSNIEMNPDAVSKFVELEKAKGLNKDQLLYVQQILKSASENGKFEREDLLRTEFLFSDLFNSIEIDNLLNDIEQIL